MIGAILTVAAIVTSYILVGMCVGFVAAYLTPNMFQWGHQGGPETVSIVFWPAIIVVGGSLFVMRILVLVGVALVGRVANRASRKPNEQTELFDADKVTLEQS